jgi:hypothetical protein
MNDQSQQNEELSIRTGIQAGDDTGMLGSGGVTSPGGGGLGSGNAAGGGVLGSGN